MFITSKYNNPQLFTTFGNRNDAEPTQRDHETSALSPKKAKNYLNAPANSTTEIIQQTFL